MSYLKELQKVFDMKSPYVEADKKLVGTWMFVNGDLMFIKYFYHDDQCVLAIHNENSGEEEKIKVKTLDAWLPDSGIYPFENGNFCIVTKTAKKQWLKSFSNNYYKLQWITINPWPGNFNTIVELSKRPCLEIYVDPKKNIYFFDRIVGYVKSSMEVVCTDLNFKQEIEDWTKYAF